jgi:PhnB protein
MSVKPIPDGYHTVTPYLTIAGVAAVIEFVKEAFGATERGRMARPDGTVMHAEVQIGDSVVMLGEATSEWRPMPSNLHLYMPDVDAVYERALQAGATSLRPPADQFYGDRSAGVKDVAGNSWWIATHVEDVSADELTRRAAEAPG